ncbi:MAG: 5'/3'-nucleotidase SurE [Deltaproteobacteria bacterium]|jgi:5'-nucleotidase|nr:5'/3'-nucleotidase SurE [Deltaproteobacteria bacterium]
MRVLLTNDDGLEADGLQAAWKALKKAGHEVVAVAPDRERSASSHSVTLRQPLTVTEVRAPGGDLGYAVSGTPADSARLGVALFGDPPFDLAVSGINNDLNLGFDANYSGTVGAAMEASCQGVPAIAVSLAKVEPYDWERAGEILVDIVSKYPFWGAPPDVVLNVNIPFDIKSPDYAWVAAQIQPAPEVIARERLDARSWSCQRTRANIPPRLDPNSDAAAFAAGRIAISPLVPVRTPLDALERLAAAASRAR